MVASEDPKPAGHGFSGLRLHAGPGVQAGLNSARQVDEMQWKQNCIDLHQVMNVVKSVYLVLEHHNEALLRVAVEICTCPVGRKVLWWNDAWPGDFQKREELRELVKEKLALALAHVKNTKPVFEEKAGADPEELEALRVKLREAETAKQASQHQQQVAELRCREAEESSAEDRKQLEAMGTSINTLRAQLRAQMEIPPDTSMQEKLAELEAKLKSSEQQCGMLTQKLGDTEHKLKASEEAQISAQKALEEAQEELKRRSVMPPPPPVQAPPREEPKQIVKEVIPQKLLDQHKKELKALKDQVEEAQNATKRAEAERDEARAALESLRSELERERRRAEEAEARATNQQPTVVKEKPKVPTRDANVQVKIEVPQKDTSKEDVIEKLTAELQEAKRRALDAEQRYTELKNKPPPTPPPPPEPKEERPRTPPPPVITGPSKEEQEELQALRKIAAEYDKALMKLAKREEQIAKLKEEKNLWEDEKMRLLRALHQLKDQLRRVQEIAEKKGYGKLVEEIMSEAKVTDTINSPEWSCFDRLYEDALRRQKKQKDSNASRNVGEKVRSRGGYIAMRTMGMGAQGELVGSAQQPHMTVPESGMMQPGGDYEAHVPGPYRYHAGSTYAGSAYVSSSPCPRCGYTASSNAAYHAGMSMGSGSGGSSPSSQAGRLSPVGADDEVDRQPVRGAPNVGVFKAGRLSITGIDSIEEAERQPVRTAPTGGVLKDDSNAPARAPAMLADLSVRPASMQHLQQRLIGPTSPPLTIASSPASTSIGFSPNLSPTRMHEVNLRNRSRSPIEMMLQHRAAGGSGGQAFARMAHSKSEPKELPRLHAERLAVADFNNAGINHLPLNALVSGPGRMRGALVMDRLAAARGARERSLSNEPQKRRPKRGGHFEEFALVGAGDGVVVPVGFRAG